MKELDTFTSPIGPLITRYLAMKRASGRRAVSMSYILRYLDRFLVSSHSADLTRETFVGWSESMGSLHANTRAARLRVVYQFCLFRRREHPDSFVPDPTQFPRRPPRPLPYIFSESDIIRLLTATGDLPPHKASLLYGAVARIGIVSFCTQPDSAAANSYALLWATMTGLIAFFTCAGRSSTSHASYPSQPTP